jgi:hypothetical protein
LHALALIGREREILNLGIGLERRGAKRLCTGGVMENETSDYYVEPVLEHGNSVIRVGDENVILAPFSTYENRVFRNINFSGL